MICLSYIDATHLSEEISESLIRFLRLFCAMQTERACWSTFSSPSLVARPSPSQWHPRGSVAPRSSWGAIDAITVPQSAPTQNALEEDMRHLFEDFAKGFQSVSSESETSGWITEVEGEIPKELTGTLLRNGPALFERNGVRKEFLDGDGMITSVAIRDGKAFFRNKFVRTESFKREETEGDFLDLSIFTAKDPRVAKTGRPIWQIRLFDDIFNGPPSPKNNGAFNAWHWGNTLVAVDFGRPFQLDKQTLETTERMDEFAKHDFTAHSRLMTESDGSQRLVCFLPFVDWAKQETEITFFEFDEQGACLLQKKFKFAPAYFHDLIVTDKWYHSSALSLFPGISHNCGHRYILFDCPIKMDYFRTFVKYPLGQVGLGDTVSEDRDRPPIFRLFPRRSDGDMIEIPVIDKHCYAYHHVNGFDLDEEGTKVVFDTCTWDNFTLYFKDIVEPDGERFFPRTQVTRFTLDLEKGHATSEMVNSRPCEYPTVAPLATGTRCGWFSYVDLGEGVCQVQTHVHVGQRCPI